MKCPCRLLTPEKVKRRRNVANLPSDADSSDRTGATIIATESAAAGRKSMGEVLATYFESRQNQKSQILNLLILKSKNATNSKINRK